MSNKINNLKMGTTMRHPILKGLLGNAFTTIGGVGTNLEENNNLEFLQGKGKNKYLSYYYVTDPKTGKRVTAQEMIKIIEKREKEKNYSSSCYVTDPVTGERVLVEEMYRKIKERENEVNEGAGEVGVDNPLYQTNEYYKYYTDMISRIDSIYTKKFEWDIWYFNKVYDENKGIYERLSAKTGIPPELIAMLVHTFIVERMCILVENML